MLYALIDIGSSTIRLAIYNIVGDHLEQIYKRKHTVGLAAYVHNEIMQTEGIDKACELLLEFKQFLTSLNITQVSAFTTAALRNCRNSNEAVQTIVDRTGIDLHIISGDQEATYDFIAITHGLDYTSGFIIDIGGGSTELIDFENSRIVHKTSLPLGGLALHTQFIQGLLPTPEEVLTMRRHIRKIIATATDFATLQHTHIVGIGGTFKGSHLLYNLLYGYTTEHTLIQTDKLTAIIDKFSIQSEQPLTDEMARQLLTAVPERLHTILPGMIIADELAHKFHATTIDYKDAGMREGFLYQHVLNV